MNKGRVTGLCSSPIVQSDCRSFNPSPAQNARGPGFIIKPEKTIIHTEPFRQIAARSRKRAGMQGPVGKTITAMQAHEIAFLFSWGSAGGMQCLVPACFLL
jgi:hypothetical protein